jgi:N-acetylmuramoyl-L-alanine amidase
MALRIMGLVVALALVAYGLVGPPLFDAPVEQAELPTLKVSAEKLNVRKSDSTDSEIVGELKRGDKVTVVEQGEAGWVKVSSGKLQGWVKRSFLAD